LEIKGGKEMKNELVLDLCFIRPIQGGFEREIQTELQNIFGEKLTWYLDVKQQEELEVVVAELRGIGSWSSEDEVMSKIEELASDTFFTWLQGYRIQLFAKEEGSVCHACSKH